MTQPRHPIVFPNRAPNPADQDAGVIRQAGHDLYEALAAGSTQFARWRDENSIARITAHVQEPGARVSLAASTVGAMLVKTTGGKSYWVGRIHADDPSGPAKQGAADTAWSVFELPTLDQATGEFVRRPGERTRYWSGPVHSQADMPEAVIGAPMWGAPDGDASRVTMVTIEASDLPAMLGYEDNRAHHDSDPVRRKLVDATTFPERSFRDPFDAVEQYAVGVRERSLGKLVTYNAAL